MQSASPSTHHFTTVEYPPHIINRTSAACTECTSGRKSACEYLISTASTRMRELKHIGEKQKVRRNKRNERKKNLQSYVGDDRDCPGLQRVRGSTIMMADQRSTLWQPSQTRRLRAFSSCFPYGNADRDSEARPSVDESQQRNNTLDSPKGTRRCQTHVVVLSFSENVYTFSVISSYLLLPIVKWIE